MDLTPTEAPRLSHDSIPDINFFQLLDREDARVTAAVKAAGCPECGGRLDQANNPRKPRGGGVGAVRHEQIVAAFREAEGDENLARGWLPMHLRFARV